MRQLLKRVAAAVLIVFCLASLTACSADSGAAEKPPIGTDGSPVDPAMAQAIVYSAAQNLSIPEDQLIVQRDLAIAQGDPDTADICTELLEVRSNMGEVRSLDLDNATAVLLADGSYTVVIPVTFAEGQQQYVVNINMMTGQLRVDFTDLSSGEAEDTSIGGLLRKASGYTLIGIGTVFFVLIFISLIISLFKYVHIIEEFATGKNKVKAAAPAPAPAAPAPAPVAVPEPEPEAEEELVTDEEELIAVITAAIQAYGGAATANNGLVVRSIRRLPKTNR